MQGLEYWKSLEELAESPQVMERLSQEFPGYDPQQITSLSRRRFMKLMSASMALAGVTLSGCRRWPTQQLAPYSSNPRDRVPGVPEQYATVYEIGGVGHGLLVSSYDGRPIKIEGNPSHPFSQTFGGELGSADAFAQASVLELYDPDRSRGPVDRTASQARPATWEEFAGSLPRLNDGFAVLSETSSSPSVAAMRDRLLQLYPQTGWYEYEPINRDNEIEGSRLAFGRVLRTRLHLEKADTIVLLDADLLGTHPAHVRYANDWVQRRRSADENRGMSRMLVAESCFSISGSVADQRIGVRPSRLPLLAAAIAARFRIGSVSETLTPQESEFVDTAAAGLRTNGVMVAGPNLPPQVHALVHAVNDAIGAVGNTLTLLEEPAGPAKSIGQLAEQIKSGNVKTLLILGGNPAYDAPADLEFAKLLQSVPASFHLSLYDNETSLQCKWHLPRAHYLECWGDARAWDGTLSIQQPLILPLYGGRSCIEVLATLCGDPAPDGQAIVRQTFGKSDAEYRRVLHDGVAPQSGFAAITAKPQAGNVAVPNLGSELEIRFQPSTSVYDGRFANNGWLQELPGSLTKLTWDNAAFFSKHDADTLGINNDDVIRIDVGGRSLEIPAFILPGQPVGVIGLPLGYGRSAAGNIGNGVGFDTYSLRTSANPRSAAGVQITKAGTTYKLATTQQHHLLDAVGIAGRVARIGEKHHSGMIVREATLDEYQHDPQAAHHGQHRTVPLQLFDPPMGEPPTHPDAPTAFNRPHAWGMAVDMNACIGCNACVVACQAENNVPVVGKDQVLNGREMHWIRIDSYFKGGGDDPQPDVVHQPMLCVHCENAPCEQVCPVAATVHDSEGLNVMVYNRCIGTRYCSNNCPYKVRRFNYFDWHSKDPRGNAKPWLGMPDAQQHDAVDKIKQMVFNPEVTVRMRGVMEKCTYCVQRIRNVQIARRTAGEEIQDGDVVTACQQACPTEAIVFGNLNDAESKVSRLHKNPRAYSVLEDLNTRPRTKHLAKLRNPARGSAT